MHIYTHALAIVCVVVLDNGINMYRPMFSQNTLMYMIQWNPSTIGPEESVLIREVSLFRGLKSTQTWHLGRKKAS